MNPNNQTHRTFSSRRLLWLSVMVLPAVLVAGVLAYAAREGGAVVPPTDVASHDEHGHEADRAEGKEQHTDEVKLTSQAIKRFGVEIGMARKTVPVDTFSAPARVGFNTHHVAHISSAVQGRITQIKVVLGDKVKKGDVLLTVDSPELGRFQGEYLAARSAAEAAEPAVEIARDAYERARQLNEESQGISLTEVQRRKSELAAARRELLAAQARRTAAENALHLYGMNQMRIKQLVDTGEIAPRYEVLAPMDGEVIEREATLGELVGPEDEKLMMLADLSDVWMLVDVAEAKLGEVGVGTPAVVELPALPGRTFKGKVAYVSPVVNQATRTARLRVEVGNPEGLLRPGMFARALLSVSKGKMSLAIPAEAVMTLEGKPAVFTPVPGEPNTFAKRAVVVGERIGGMVPILSGLRENERFVTAGAFILKAEIAKAGVEHEH